MALSLNQILARFRTLGLAHKQINTVYFGQPSDFDIQGGSGNVTYPALFIEKLPGVTSRATHQHRYNFRLYFYDLVKVAEGTNDNRDEVLSDMDSVALDFLAMLMSATYQDDWVIVDDVAEESREEQLGDMVAGSVREVGIFIDFLADNCQVPQDEVTFNEDFDMARTRIFKYTGTGVEGDSFIPTDDDTGVTLAGRIILAAYRAGDYKRPIITTPVGSDHIKVAGSVLTDRKGILSTTGSVGLQTGDGLLSGEVLDFILWE